MGWTLNPIWLISLEEDAKRHKNSTEKERHVKTGRRLDGCFYKEGVPRTAGTTGSREEGHGTNSLPEPSERGSTAPPTPWFLICRLFASGTGRESTLFKVTQFVILCWEALGNEHTLLCTVQMKLYNWSAFNLTSLYIPHNGHFPSTCEDLNAMQLPSHCKKIIENYWKGVPVMAQRKMNLTRNHEDP